MATRDITLDVTIRARTAEAAKAEAALKAIDERAKHAGKSMEGMSGDAKILDAELKRSEATIKELDRTLLEFGNDKSVRQRLRQERSWFSELKRLEKDLAPDVGAAVTNNFGQQLSGAFSGVGSHMTGVLVGTLVGAVVAAAPTIGAILGGAVAGATGTGALAVGILAASKDSRVQDAAHKFGQAVMAEFFGSGEAFVQPVIDSLGILEKAFADIHLGDSLAKVAPEVRVIASGIADLVREFWPGFNKALDRMGPLADAAARGFGDLGDSLGDMLDRITRSEGTVEGIETLFLALAGTIRVVGHTLGWLGDRFHEFNVFQAKVFGDLEDINRAVGLDGAAGFFAKLNDVFERMTGTGESLHGMFRKLGTEGVDPFAGYVHHAWQEMEQLRGETEATRKALVDYLTTLRGMDDANIAWEQSLDDLTKSVQDNGTSLDIHTEKGRNNERAVLAGIDAAKRQYEQGLITSAQYDQQIKQLIALGVQLGLSRQALQQLAGKYEVDVVINAVATGAQKLLGMVTGWLGGGSTGTVQINTGRPVHESFASGGVTPAFAPFEVHSGEMLWSNRQHYVSTAAQTQALMSGASGTTKVEHELRVSGDSTSWLYMAIDNGIRTGQLKISSKAIVG